MKTSLNVIPRLIALSAAIFVLLVLVNWIFGSPMAIGINLLFTFLFTMLYTISLYYANAGVFAYLDRVFAHNRFSARRIVIGFLCSFVVSLLVVFVLRVLEDVAIEGRSFRQYLDEETPANYVFATVVTFFITLAAYAIGFYKAYKENQLQEQKIIAGTASAQFESLKSQIDPHFLFNSLNVLSSLIEENPDMAQKFTTSLSKVYRYVLDQRNKELVTVEEELAFAKTYMNLLRMRFEDSLTFELPSEIEDPEGKVVPLSLQLLLENAIKHNVVSEQRPLHIRIYFEGNRLVVSNNLQKKEVLGERRGVGLQNIVNRYAILTDRHVTVSEDESHFTIKLPILTELSFVGLAEHQDESQSYYRAKKHVDALKGFYGNVIAYCCVIPILIFINLRYVPQFHWFWFSVGGWGSGLAIHAIGVFGYGVRWEERQIRKLLAKEQTRTWK